MMAEEHEEDATAEFAHQDHPMVDEETKHEKDETMDYTDGVDTTKGQGSGEKAAGEGQGVHDRRSGQSGAQEMAALANPLQQMAAAVNALQMAAVAANAAVAGGVGGEGDGQEGHEGGDEGEIGAMADGLVPPMVNAPNDEVQYLNNPANVS